MLPGVTRSPHGPDGFGGSGDWLTLPKLRLLQLLRLALLALPRPTADAPSELVDADHVLGFGG